MFDKAFGFIIKLSAANQLLYPVCHIPCAKFILNATVLFAI
jgi:hypothetical protein